jgi:hypothetical protein
LPSTPGVTVPETVTSPAGGAGIVPLVGGAVVGGVVGAVVAGPWPAPAPSSPGVGAGGGQQPGQEQAGQRAQELREEHAVWTPQGAGRFPASGATLYPGPGRWSA